MPEWVVPLSSRDRVLRLLEMAPEGLRAPEILRAMRPRISQPTLWRILAGLRGEGRVVVEGRARATRYYSSQADAAGRRSLRLHRFAARRLAENPDLRNIVRQRLDQLRSVNPHGRVYHDRWQTLLDGPLPTLLREITAVAESNDALRKESPMTVLVTPEERRRAFEYAQRG